ncbi:MAG: hypothetical protein Q6363_002895 [Candidatus Njordarchaeota archaeon]
MRSKCDPTLVLEIISDIIGALRAESEVEVYRYFEILRRYLKGKKCSKETLERALRLLESVRDELSHGFLLILNDIIEDLKQRLPKKKTKSARKKSTKTRRRRKYHRR